MRREDVDYVKAVMASVAETMFEVDEVVRLVLVALFARGHVLLESNPGLGKTMLVKTVSRQLGFSEERWGRIQFTPDLMPSDITGTDMPEDGNPGRFSFRPGPIFRWLLLADEINRATPKTQSAMLEAMAERQVTVLGKTHRLAHPVPVLLRGRPEEAESPFMVLATQNPIDQEGVFDLPEAQADRFMFKVRMPFPSADGLAKIMQKDAGPRSPATAPAASGPSESDALAHYAAIREAVLAETVLPVVADHILNMVVATNGAVDQLRGLDARAQRDVAAWHASYVEHGVGPRAATALLLGVKAYAGLFLGGRDHGPRALTRLVRPVLRHRLKLRFGWERLMDEVDRAGVPAHPDARHDALLGEFVLLTAPSDRDYRTLLQQGLQDGEWT